MTNILHHNAVACRKCVDCYRTFYQRESNQVRCNDCRARGASPRSMLPRDSLTLNRVMRGMPGHSGRLGFSSSPDWVWKPKGRLS